MSDLKIKGRYEIDKEMLSKLQESLWEYTLVKKVQPGNT